MQRWNKSITHARAHTHTYTHNYVKLNPRTNLDDSPSTMQTRKLELSSKICSAIHHAIKKNKTKLNPMNLHLQPWPFKENNTAKENSKPKSKTLNLWVWHLGLSVLGLNSWVLAACLLHLLVEASSPRLLLGFPRFGKEKYVVGKLKERTRSLNYTKNPRRMVWSEFLYWCRSILSNLSFFLCLGLLSLSF